MGHEAVTTEHETGGPPWGPPVASGPEFVRCAWPWWLAHVGGMAATGVLAARPRSSARLRVLFAGAVALHVGEAFVAWHLSRDSFPAERRAWTLQTLALGYPSLLALRRAIQRAGPVPGYVVAPDPPSSPPSPSSA